MTKLIFKNGSLVPASVLENCADVLTKCFSRPQSLRCTWLKVGNWRGQTETGDQGQGTPGCLQQRDSGEIINGGECMGETTLHWLERNTGDWSNQRTQGTVPKGGATHPDDPWWGALQPQWRIGATWMLHCDFEGAGGWSWHKTIPAKTWGWLKHLVEKLEEFSATWSWY